MFIIEMSVIIIFFVIVIGSLKTIDEIEKYNQSNQINLDDSMIPYEELQFREEINSMSLEEIDEYFSYDDIDASDIHSMIDEDYMIEYKADDSVSINYEMFEDTIPF